MVAIDKYNWEQKFYDLWIVIQRMQAEETHISWVALGDGIGVSNSTLRSALTRVHGLTRLVDVLKHLGTCIQADQREEAREAALIFTDKKQKDNPDWREWAGLAEKNQNFGQRIDDSQRIAHIKIETDVPISLMFSGDWHLGAQGVAYSAWIKDIEYLLQTPNLYMAEVGDDRENMRSFRMLSSVLNQVLSPKQQAHMLRGVIEDLTANDKLIAKVGGNHDEEFDQRIFGEALQGYLLEKMKAPRFKNRGLVYLTVGEIEYTMLLFHKSRFRSFLRATHGGMREQQLSFPADIIAGGHDHKPGMEHGEHYTLAQDAGEQFGGEYVIIKVGTYNDSEYGWRYFHNGGFACNYTTVLFPDQKRIIPFADPRAAVRFANTFR